MESLIIRALLGAMPIIVSLALMVFFNISAVKAMPPSWLLSVIIARVFWRMPADWIMAASLEGVLTALNILIIVFGAVLLLNTMKLSGYLEVISKGFSSITADRRIQALLIGFGFATLIEGTSGFGTPAALAAPLMVGIGFPPLAAAITALIGHAPAVSFGAVGTPVLSGLAPALNQPEIHEALHQPFSKWILEDASIWNANFHFLGALIVPFLIVIYLTVYFGKGKGIRKSLAIWPLLLVTGLTFAATQNLITRLTGPELPSITAGLMVIIVISLMARYQILIPGEVWLFPGEKRKTEEEEQGSLLMACLPYLLVILLLFVTRVEAFGLQLYFSRPDLSIANLLGTEIGWSWNWLYNPGIFPFIFVSAISWLFYRMKGREVREVVSLTSRQLLPATIAMCAAVAMAYVMMRSSYNLLQLDGMLISMAEASSMVFNQAFPMVSPWIGILGSFISGSNTVSNIIFSSYQYQVASELQLSRTVMVALQSTGAAVGNIISIHNIVAVLTVVGALGKEGIVIRRNFLAVTIYAVVVGLAGMIVLRLFPYLF